MFKSEYPGKTLKQGDKGDHVRHLQEWLSLHGNNCEPDGKFGSATEAAVKAFQNKRIGPKDGMVDVETWRALEYPLANAAAIDPGDRPITLKEMIIRIARIHLWANPREVGGPNMGPWVRHYMKGNEGEQWPWCAGFVSSIVYQSFACAGKPVTNFAYTFSCDLLMENAKKQGTVIPKPTPGCIFVKRGKASGDWVHTGIVIEVNASDGVMKTIEGNTNTTGSREGIAVCSLTRALTGYDYVLIR